MVPAHEFVIDNDGDAGFADHGIPVVSSTSAIGALLRVYIDLIHCDTNL